MRLVADVAVDGDSLAALGLDLCDEFVKGSPAAAGQDGLAPSRPNSFAVARPIPELAPVMMAVLLESVDMIETPLGCGASIAARAGRRHPFPARETVVGMGWRPPESLTCCARL